LPIRIELAAPQCGEHFWIFESASARTEQWRYDLLSGENALVGRGVMPSEAAKYIDYARKCITLAKRAKSDTERDKLVDLARVWMSAAMAEEEVASCAGSSSSASTHVASIPTLRAAAEIDLVARAIDAVRAPQQPRQHDPVQQ
jgi:hypothetical protein